MALTPDRRTTESGIEVKPVYEPDDARAGRTSRPGSFPFTRGPYPDMYRGRPWTMRQYAGFGSAEETNARFRTLLARGQTGLSVAFDLPTQLGYDSDDPLAEGEVGRTGVAIDSVDDMARLLEGIPLDEVSTSMTINAPAALLLLCYELVAEERGIAGDALRGTVQNDVLKEYVARGNYIFPPRPVDAAHDRPVRLLRRADPELEHDLDLRLPHPRGGLDGRAGARVHARERDRVLRGSRRGRALARRVRHAALVLLQRAQRRAAGGREVPGRAPPVGGDHARPLRRRRARRRRPCASTRRRAARRSPRSSRRTTSFASPRRRSRRSTAAPSRSTRTASTRRSRCRPSVRRRSRSGRSRSSCTRRARPTRPTRSAAPGTSSRSPTSSSRSRRRADRADRRPRRRRRRDRGRLGAGPDRGVGVPLAARGRDRASG